MYQHHVHTLFRANHFTLILTLAMGLVGILGLTPMAVTEVTAQTSTSTPMPTVTPTPYRQHRIQTTGKNPSREGSSTPEAPMPDDLRNGRFCAFISAEETI